MRSRWRPRPAARRSACGSRRRDRRWSQENLSDITSAISDFVLIYLLDPLEDCLVGVPWWMVGGRVRAGRLAGLRAGDWRSARFACITAIGMLGMWDFAMGTLSPGARRGRHHHRVRDPARDPGGARATGSSSLSRPGARRDADDAGVRVPGAGAAPDRARTRAGDHRLVHLRPAGGDPAHEPGDPAGAARRSSRPGERSARRRGSSCARSSSRWPGRRSCWA